jgi:thioredoxin 1
MIEQLAAENEGAVVVGKVNIDDNPRCAQEYQISTIPTLMIFKGGQLVSKLGPQSKSRVQQAIDAAKA